MAHTRRQFLKISSVSSAAVLSLPSLSPAAIPINMNKDDFKKKQNENRKKLLSLLGDLPWNYTQKQPHLRKTEQHEGYTLEYWDFDFNGLETVPGILLIPNRVKDNAPAMLYCHAHFGTYEVGKEELFNGRTVMPAYASVYANKGIVTLAIDSWCFGQRNTRSELDTAKEMLWRGRTLFGMMLFDEMRALDFLLSRKEVDPKRVGVFGLSMGATKAWWLSALDTRITACLDLCCMTDFEELMKSGNLKGHSIYYYVPSLLKHFNTSTINELIVPRPHLSLNGRFDELTPPKGVEKVRDYLLPLYEKYGKREDCRIDLFDCGHEELPEMRNIIFKWLDEKLLA
jgi:hypothetical protein